MKFRLVSSLSLILAMVASILSPSVALAACNPGRTDNGTYYWVDRHQDNNGSVVHGIQSRMSTYSAYVKNGFSYAWDMLTTNASWTWAQIGNYENAGYVRHTSIQYAYGCCQAYQIDLAAQAVGTSHTETVSFISPNSFRFLTDGSADYSDIHMSWTPTGAYISTEITTLANQMMGDASTNQLFQSNQIQLSGGWISFTGILESYNSHFSESGYAGSFNVWDLCR
jgi:hypothetical protein